MCFTCEFDRVRWNGLYIVEQCYIFFLNLIFVNRARSVCRQSTQWQLHIKSESLGVACRHPRATTDNKWWNFCHAVLSNVVAAVAATMVATKMGKVIIKSTRDTQQHNDNDDKSVFLCFALRKLTTLSDNKIIWMPLWRRQPVRIFSSSRRSRIVQWYVIK